MAKQVGPVTPCLECNDGNWEELQGCVRWMGGGGVGWGVVDWWWRGGQSASLRRAELQSRPGSSALVSLNTGRKKKKNWRRDLAALPESAAAD